MKTPRVSVVMPHYGGADVRRTLSALLRQSHPNLEVVAVGLPLGDLSGYELGTIKKPVRHLSGTKDLSTASVLNYAKEQLKGDFFTVVDAGDYVQPQYVSQLVELAAHKGASLACVNLFEVGGPKRLPPTCPLMTSLADVKKSLCSLRMLAPVSNPITYQDCSDPHLLAAATLLAGQNKLPLVQLGYQKLQLPSLREKEELTLQLRKDLLLANQCMLKPELVGLQTLSVVQRKAIASLFLHWYACKNAYLESASPLDFEAWLAGREVGFLKTLLY